jgi:hypothetical protein
LGFLEGLLKSPDSRSDANAHLLCDFSPRRPGTSQAGDLRGVHDRAWTPKANSTRLRIAKPGSDPFLNERPFKFSHCPDDLEHEPTGRCAEVDVVPETDERNTIGIEIGKSVHQMFQRTAEAINLPDSDQIELAPMGVRHEAIQLRSPLTGTGDTFIDVFGYDLPASAGTILAQLRQLHLGVLSVERADAGIQSDTHASPFETPYGMGGYAGGAGKHISSECIRLASRLNSTSHTRHLRDGP